MERKQDYITQSDLLEKGWTLGLIKYLPDPIKKGIPATLLLHR